MRFQACNVQMGTWALEVVWWYEIEILYKFLKIQKLFGSNATYIQW
jgi:hypothetical protein